MAGLCAELLVPDVSLKVGDVSMGGRELIVAAGVVNGRYGQDMWQRGWSMGCMVRTCAIHVAAVLEAEKGTELY